MPDFKRHGELNAQAVRNIIHVCEMADMDEFDFDDEEIDRMYRVCSGLLEQFAESLIQEGESQAVKYEASIKARQAGPLRNPSKEADNG